ncbi:hypothetical protein D9M73_65870 [compost metagenome]
MATMPPPPAGAPAGPAADPSMMGAPGAAPGMETPEPPEDDGSYEICIRVSADGRLSVGVEKGSAEEQGEDESAYRPAENIKDALTKALDIFKADGKSEAADDAFNAGFSGMSQQQGA